MQKTWPRVRSHPGWPVQPAQRRCRSCLRTEQFLSPLCCRRASGTVLGCVLGRGAPACQGLPEVLLLVSGREGNGLGDFWPLSRGLESHLKHPRASEVFWGLAGLVLKLEETQNPFGVPAEGWAGPSDNTRCLGVGDGSTRAVTWPRCETRRDLGSVGAETEVPR